jgi:hypothetical protein
MKPLIIFLTLTNVILAFAQPPETLWTRTYGWDGFYYANVIRQTTDGGFVIGGYSRVIGESEDWRLVRTDANGDTLWTHSYGSEFSDRAFDLEITPDGGCVVTGSWGWKSLPGADSSDIGLMKVDSMGNMQWFRTYLSAEENYAYDVEMTSDGGYIIVGHTHDGGQVTYYDWFVVKTNSVGDTMWTWRHNPGSYDEAQSVVEVDDGGYVIAKWDGNWTPPWDPDISIIKLSVNGSMEWQRLIGGDGSDQAFAIEKTLDGGYIVTGRSYAYGGIYLLKLNAEGDSLWLHSYPDIDVNTGNSLNPTQDGGYVILGTPVSTGLGSLDYFVVRTDSIGDILWTERYGGLDNDEGESIIVTNDCGYAVAGYSRSFTSD